MATVPILENSSYDAYRMPLIVDNSPSMQKVYDSFDRGVKNETGVLGAGTGGSGGYSAPAAPSYNQDDLNYLNDQEAQLRRLLQSAQQARADGTTRLQDSYNQETSQANQRRSRALEDFGIQREDTTRGKQTAINNTNTNARTLSDSIRRMIGMASGSNSSAYQLAAPNAVARSASINRNNVMDTFGKNFRDLDLSERRAKDDFESLLSDLAAQKQSRMGELESGVLSQEQGIYESLANLASERAKLQGGGYGAVRVARQPYLNEINNRQNQIDQIFSKYRTPYSVKAVNVQKPNLRNYTVDKYAISQNKTAGQEPYSPYSQFLKKQAEEAQL